MVFGKEIRLSRITRNGRILCIPMDHGVSSGPVKGLDTILNTVELVSRGGATAILTHKGVIKAIKKPPSTGIIMHLSGSTSLGTPNWKVQVGSVEEAIRLGSDAVSVHVNIGNKDEPDMLTKLGRVADECDEWQIPFIAMMYARGENIKNPEDPDTLAHVARIGSELGADIVKVPMPSRNVEEIRRVIRGCTAPVVAAGGPKLDNELDVLLLAKAVIEAGGVGVTFGRNVFQHEDPESMTRALRAIVIENESVEEAMSLLRIKAPVKPQVSVNSIS